MDITDHISDHFTVGECACHCGCGRMILNHTLVDRLEKARRMAGFPFDITSWNRCAKHNLDEGGKEDSAHLSGTAVDILASAYKLRCRLIFYLALAGFQRIGVGKSFVHADVDITKPWPAIWFY